MDFVFRADASATIGSGHAMRCRNLARELVRRGHNARFICADLPGNLISFLRNDGLTVDVIAPAAADNEDADRCLAVLDRAAADWVVVDHYALSAIWERKLRTVAKSVMAIDDLADRAHDADILLDQNFATTPADRYRDLVGTDTQMLLGPRFALLNETYLPWARPSTGDRQEVRRILIYFGGGDQADMTGRVLAALSTQDFEALEIDVVVGAMYPHRDNLARAAAHRPRTNLHPPQASLATLIAAADLAIGAGGSTTWERLCLGVPTVLISLAANQVPATRDLAAEDCVVDLGSAEVFDATALQSTMKRLLSDPSRRAKMAQAGQLLIDGLGCRRVAEVLSPSATARLSLRPATLSDAAFLFQLGNDPEVRRQSFTAARLAWPSHVAWLTAKLADPGTRFFVLETDRLPIGQVRFDVKGSDALISYAVDPIVRGRGWGKRIVELGMQNIAGFGAQHVVAEVKAGNQPSCAALRGLGFTQSPSSDGEKVIFTRALDQRAGS